MSNGVFNRRTSCGLSRPGRGAQRLRCGETGQRPQAPHCRRCRWSIADGAHDAGRYRRFDRRPLLDKARFFDCVVEVVRRLAGQQGFAPLPRRWVVERTFVGMMRWRRLVSDDEMRLGVSTVMMHVALSSLLLQRLLIPE